jgi:hypothetical protein
MKKELERRSYNVEIRGISGEEGSKKLRGIAAVFNSMSEDLGGFRELIAPGAFKASLEQCDCRALFNHDPNMVLGRTTSGTLRLQETDAGLEFEVDLPDTEYSRNLQTLMDRGDINQCSFGFSVSDGGDIWFQDEEKNWVRTIITVGRLYDVSPVTYPAYPETSCAMRSLDAVKSNIQPPEAGIGHIETLKRKLDVMAIS